MKKISQKRFILYIILILASCAIRISLNWYRFFPFGKIALYQHKFLASMPTECKTNCNKTEWYRDGDKSCIIKKVDYHVDKDGNIKATSISKQSLNNWVVEKGKKFYIMRQDTHSLFEKLCYDFETRSYK